MEELFDIYDFDVICDIESEAESSWNEETFFEKIKQDYSAELNDIDDKPLVYIGICLAYLKRGKKPSEELEELAKKSLKDKNLLERMTEDEEYFKSFKKWRLNFLKSLEKGELKQSDKQPYISPFTNWRKNDIYSMPVKSEEAPNEKYVFFRVIRKEEEKNKYYPFVHLFFIPGYNGEFSPDLLEHAVFLPVSNRYSDENMYDYIHEILDDHFRYTPKREIKYLGNYEMTGPIDEKIPPKLMHSRLCFENIEAKIYYGVKILRQKMKDDTLFR